MPTETQRLPPLRAIALVAVGGALVRLALAARDVAIVDRLFVPDDTYYTLAIARSIAHGLGPSVDGVHLTSGFQPLIAFLLAPVFVLSNDPDVGLRAALVLGALADAVTIGLVGSLARRASGDRAGLFAALIWGFSPVAIANALGGLETSLAIACELSFVWVAARAWESGIRRDALVAGLLAGLSLLARIDAALLVGLVGLGFLATRRLRALAFTAGAATLVVTPWWGLCIALFGSPIPSSGAAVREIVAQQHGDTFTFAKQLAWAAGTLVATPITELQGLRETLFEAPSAGVALFALVVAGLVVLARLLRSRPWPEQAVAWFALAIVGFYAAYVPAIWFMRRYLAPAELALAILTAVALAKLADRFRTGQIAIVACLALSSLDLARWAFTSPDGTLDTGFAGAKGYRSAALEVLDTAPAGAVIGSLQSGALEYLASTVNKHQRVVNLDGVVDAEAAAAYRGRHLLSFAQARGVTHLADWTFNLVHVVRDGADGTMPVGALRVLGKTSPQGEDQFTILELDWAQAQWQGAR